MILVLHSREFSMFDIVIYQWLTSRIVVIRGTSEIRQQNLQPCISCYSTIVFVEGSFLKSETQAFPPRFTLVGIFVSQFILDPMLSSDS